MFSAEDILQKLESAPWAFSVVHRCGGGADINRRVFVNLVRSGATVIEVGANKGSYTVLLSRLVGLSGTVHAFEPVTESFERLTARLRTANATNVRAWNMAVADGNTDDAEIIIPGDDSQQASLVAHRAGSWVAHVQRKERIKVTSLDAFFAKHNIERVDFLKLDVEGAELSILRGGAECLRQSKPILHLELNPEWLSDFKTTTAEVLQSLRSQGYNFAYKIDSSKLKGFSQLGSVEMETLRDGRTSGDFLFSAGPI